ncbi:hypothetical protein AAE478_000336 [Parahypoxylon ruwenzoriense]
MAMRAGVRGTPGLGVPRNPAYKFDINVLIMMPRLRLTGQATGQATGDPISPLIAAMSHKSMLLGILSPRAIR